MILSIFVYKSRFSCPFFYRQPPSADVFINKNRSFQCILFTFALWYNSRRRPGAENERERPVPLLNKYDFGSRASFNGLFRSREDELTLRGWNSSPKRAAVPFWLPHCMELPIHPRSRSFFSGSSGIKPLIFAWIYPELPFSQSCSRSFFVCRALQMV